MDYKFLIGGVEYGKSGVRSVTIEAPLFDKLSAGNACAAQLNISFRPTEMVPRMAEIIPFARNNSGEDWKQLGVFYTDERSQSAGGVMTLVAYDSMLKAEVEWIPSQNLVFPMSMPDAVAEIARIMGIGIDARTELNADYTIDYPANGYTLRDVLRYIAGAHMGNWIITANNELLLIPLFSSLPAETNHLITEDGDVITFGGVAILI